jgi:hypothetical protein
MSFHSYRIEFEQYMKCSTLLSFHNYTPDMELLWPITVHLHQQVSLYTISGKKYSRYSHHCRQLCYWGYSWMQWTLLTVKWRLPITPSGPRTISHKNWEISILRSKKSRNKVKTSLSHRNTSRKRLAKLIAKDNSINTKQEQENKKCTHAVWTTVSVSHLFRDHQQYHAW